MSWHLAKNMSLYKLRKGKLLNVIYFWHFLVTLNFLTAKYIHYRPRLFYLLGQCIVLKHQYFTSDMLQN